MKTVSIPLEPIGDQVLSIDSWSPQRASPNDEFEYIDIATVDRESKCLTETTLISAADAPSRARQIVSGGDVLVSTVRPNLNAVAMVPEELSDVVASTGFCVLRSNPKKLDRNYLFHWVRTTAFVGDMVRKATGASYPAVSDRIIKESKIPLPPLSEQKRIADILDKADAIRRKRQERLSEYRSLLESSYLDLFGHPLVSQPRWELTTLRALAKFNRGKFTPRPRNDPRYYGGSFPFIQTGELSACDGYLRNWRQTLNEEGTRVSRRFPPRTVCIALVGATIGETAILDFESYFPDSLIGIQAKPDRSTPEFLEYTLRFYKEWFRRRAPETARANINVQTLEALLIPSPPYTQQTGFSAIYRQVDKLRTHEGKATLESNALFNSLVQRAFKGEL